MRVTKTGSKPSSIGPGSAQQHAKTARHRQQCKLFGTLHNPTSAYDPVSSRKNHAVWWAQVVKSEVALAAVDIEPRTTCSAA